MIPFLIDFFIEQLTEGSILVKEEECYYTTYEDGTLGEYWSKLPFPLMSGAASLWKTQGTVHILASDLANKMTLASVSSSDSIHSLLC